MTETLRAGNLLDMKTFDELLEAAFEAGYDRGADDVAQEERGVGPHTGRPPSYEEWRASLSGIDLSPSPVAQTEVELERAERRALCD